MATRLLMTLILAAVSGIRRRFPPGGKPRSLPHRLAGGKGFGDDNGNGGGGGGSILINNTDLGDTYQYADDYDDDGIEDNMDNCPHVINNSQADSDGDGFGGDARLSAAVGDVSGHRRSADPPGSRRIPG